MYGLHVTSLSLVFTNLGVAIFAVRVTIQKWHRQVLQSNIVLSIAEQTYDKPNDAIFMFVHASIVKCRLS